MGFTPCFLCVNMSSSSLKYTGRTVMISTCSLVPRLSQGWGRVAYELLSVCGLAGQPDQRCSWVGVRSPFPVITKICALPVLSAALNFWAFLWSNAQGSMYQHLCNVKFASGGRGGSWHGADRLSDRLSRLQCLLPPIFCLQDIKCFPVKHKPIPPPPRRTII